MTGLLRKPLVWGLILLVAAGAGLAAWRMLAIPEPDPAAAPAVSPYAAAANGKVDVEGGMIPVAARRAGIIRDVLVNEGDVVTQGQVLARQEDDEPRLAAARASPVWRWPSPPPVASVNGYRVWSDRTSSPPRSSTRRTTRSGRPKPIWRPDMRRWTPPERPWPRPSTSLN
jgi:hypothetical protein